MTLEARFDLNQKVWAIGNSNHGIYRPNGCNICNRKGTVELSGELLTCPKCGGQSVPPQWSVEIKQGTVVRIHAVRSVNFIQDAATEGLSRKEGWDNRNSYMLGQVGCGVIWPEDCLFASEQEAETECENRNRELAK